ncbi:TPA: 2,3-diphosphoglycerate-dependent phosphoglycerate mutase [Candidatus Woesearchaeota archaeon]|nr:2,3-diphosphoglycerate-dependent phosphoglycerate mutase [Candidatus Woesearchaeota archaeon]HII68917.1 2,3-diphosphoglycerate-dependent phosphoglycerate mutase [Candidatus Woesearchaeota archaeon]
MTYTVVFLRHGQSEWNLANRFTGWTDVSLTPRGEQEAHEAGKDLKKAGFAFDLAFTNMHKRAIRTLWIVLEELDLMWIPQTVDWRLNERHYGALTGKNKAETLKQYGEEQFTIWRRGYATPPPEQDKDDALYPGNNPTYAWLKDNVPTTECLKDTVNRAVPCWNGVIAPGIKEGKRVIIAASGNSLRAIVKHLDKVSDDDIVHLNIPTGIPLVYELNNSLKPMRHYYVGDNEKIKRVTEEVASQGKK